jgi:hypothetical protein
MSPALLPNRFQRSQRVRIVQGLLGLSDISIHALFRSALLKANISVARRLWNGRHLSSGDSFLPSRLF